MTLNKISVVTLVATISLLAGCATSAPPYAVSIPAIQTLKNGSSSGVSVGEFTAQGSAANNESISIRGNSMVSPQGTFAKYLQNALVQELTDAKLLNPQSQIQITATLLKNDISAGGFITASAEIEARFVVKRGAQVAFDKVKQATIEWGSNFVGAIAIPRAHENYPRLVSALLTTLYADDDFFKAIK